MTRIKLCGLSRICDIDTANVLMPEYIGFVFWQKSKRYVSPELALNLRENLAPRIHTVGVFVDENPEFISSLVHHGVIDVIQLHGHEDDEYISHLRTLAPSPIIKAFKIASPDDTARAIHTSADYIMLDSGKGSGTLLDWEILRGFSRPYFLAGGLTPNNIAAAINMLRPFAVDVSSGIETHGIKDKEKMTAFVNAVRQEDNK